MDWKKIRKSIPRFMGWFAILAGSSVIKLIPRRWLYGFANTIANLGFALAVKQRKIALECLHLAFGNELSKKEVERIARDSFIYMARSGFELISMMDKPAIIKQCIGFENKKHLDAALARGKGVILVSAHFGNFPLLLSRLSQEGYNISGIMRPMRDARVEKIFLQKREKYHVKTIYSQPRNVCVERTIRALRNNEIVFIHIDQNFGTGGVFVNFFGRQAATATGPIIFAQRTQASLLPCFILRQKNNHHKIVFEPPLDLKEGKSPKETVLINIQRLTDIIESYIRRYPAEWSWIHRRWKTKPN
ncbi:MAG: lysophospholipid acyltransferase family protein [Candidatus Omnitrophota bacterium]